MYERCSKLAMKIPKRHHCCCSVVFIVDFEQISHIVLMFLLLNLNKYLSPWLSLPTIGRKFRYLDTGAKYLRILKFLTYCSAFSEKNLPLANNHLLWMKQRLTRITTYIFQDSRHIYLLNCVTLSFVSDFYKLALFLFEKMFSLLHFFLLANIKSSFVTSRSKKTEIDNYINIKSKS